MSFDIKGADGNPIAIKDGEYYFNTKARCRRMMRNSLSSDARRVYACLEIGTMGFQQELAVVQENGKRRPMTHTDITDMSGLRKQHENRGFEELKAQGLADSQVDDDGTSRKGHIKLYSWAEPRRPQDTDSNRARLLYPAWFPPSWEPFKPLINRYKWKLTADEVTARDYYDEGAKIARDYEKAEIVAARFLDRLRAAPKSTAHKKKKERKEPKETTTTRAPQPPAEDVVVVGEKFRQYGLITDKDVAQFLAECREQSPECTAADVVAAMATVKISRNTRTPIGLLRTQVPALLPLIAATRRENEQKEKTVQQEQDHATARSILENPEAYREDDRIWARAFMGANDVAG